MRVMRFVVPLLLAAVTVWAGPAPAISVKTNKTVRVCGGCAGQPYFEVAVRDAKTRKLMMKRAPVALEVASGGAQDPSLVKHFAFAWEALQKAPAQLAMTVGQGLQTPGTYEVRVDLLPASGLRNTVETFQVTVPAAQIETSGKLLIERTVYGPFGLGGSSEKKLPLWVREKGRQAGVAKLESESDPFAIDADHIFGTVNLSKPLTLTPGSTIRDIPYELAGEFPLGKAAGKLRLFAPELQDPVAVDVEVRSRLHAWMLVVAILLGLLVSWLTKVKLAQWIAVSQARALADKLMIEISADRAKYAEPEFAGAVDPAIEGLTAARNGSDAAVIDRQRSALDSAWRAAAQQAEARRADFRAKAAAFADLVAMDWHLPQPVAGAVPPARIAAAAAQANIQPDVTLRVRALANAQRPLLDALEHMGAEWQRGVTDLFSNVVAQRDGLPDDLIVSLAAAIGDWPKTYPRPTGLPAPFDPVRVEPALRSVAGQYLAGGDAVAVMDRRLTRTIADVAGELGGAAAAALPTVVAQVPVVLASARGSVDDPATHGPSLLQTLKGLQVAWRTDITPHLATASPEAKLAAAENIRKQLYRAAAALKPSPARLLSVAAATAQATPATAPEALTLPVVPPFMPGAILDLAGRAVGSPYVTLLIRSLADLRKAKGVQTLVVALLFLAWALGSFGAKWDGTWPGLFDVFVAAFSVDVAADALLGKVKAAG